jgi:hypothetical protein
MKSYPCTPPYKTRRKADFFANTIVPPTAFGRKVTLKIGKCVGKKVIERYRVLGGAQLNVFGETNTIFDARVLTVVGNESVRVLIIQLDGLRLFLTRLKNAPGVS